MPRYSVPDSLIVRYYTQDHLTYRQIAARIGMSHAAVAKRLKRAGITAAQGEHVQTTCARCSEPIDRTRARARQSFRMYCSKECYFATRENPQFVQSRHGGYVARAVVAKHFKLEPQNIVHHKDTNQANNALDNLAVFADQSAHLKHHHALAVGHKGPRPLWDGAS